MLTKHQIAVYHKIQIHTLLHLMINSIFVQKIQTIILNSGKLKDKFYKSPTYDIIFSSDVIDEGDLFNPMIKTTNVATGTILYYKLTGIPRDDIVQYSLVDNENYYSSKYGSVKIHSNETGSIFPTPIVLKNLIQDDVRTVTIKFY